MWWKLQQERVVKWKRNNACVRGWGFKFSRGEGADCHSSFELHWLMTPGPSIGTHPSYATLHRHHGVHYSPRCRAVKYIKDGWIFATGKHERCITHALLETILNFFPFFFFFIYPVPKTIPLTEKHIIVYYNSYHYSSVQCNLPAFVSCRFSTSWQHTRSTILHSTATSSLL